MTSRGFKLKYKFTLGILKLVARLPLWLLYCFANFIYLVVYYIVGYRRKVVSKNLSEAFPDKTPDELRRIEKDFYRHLCDVIVETIKLLAISDKEMKRRVEVVNPELVMASVENGKSAVLLLGHYGNWEWVQEISRHFKPAALFSIYHPLNNSLWDEVYGKIRSRWNVDIISQKQSVKTLLDKKNQPWICGFIADARPRSTDKDAVVPFLNHDTSFIYGPEVIGRKIDADFFFLDMEKIKRGRYRITFNKIEAKEGDADIRLTLPYPVSREFWKLFGNRIERDPAFWLWSHKRWKYDNIIIPVASTNPDQ